MGRLSGPLMDRFDLRIEVPPVAIGDLEQPAAGEASAGIAARIAAATAPMTGGDSAPSTCSIGAAGGTLLAIAPFTGPAAPIVGARTAAEVCALVDGGGYAERVLVPAAQLLPVPKGVDLTAAAGLPEVACTVWSNVFMTANLQPDETFLVHGGSSGIGTMAIQLAKAAGARVAVTAGSEDKLAFCRELGADIAINYREQDFVEAVREATHDGADVILDLMGGDYLDRNLQALAPGGRLVVIGLMGGQKGKQIAQGKGPPSQTDVVEVAGAIVSDRGVERMVAALDDFTAAAKLLTAAIDRDVDAKAKLTTSLNRNSDVSDDMREQIRETEAKLDRLREELIRSSSNGGGMR